MNTLAAIGWLARADFLERTRRASFLLLLMLALWMAWLVHDGTLKVQLGDYRGVWDSAWIGMVLTVVGGTFVSLFGFYVVKDPLTRDRSTGVGQIIAATPTGTATYLLGKWLSNTAVLGAILAVLVLAAFPMQWLHGESGVYALRQVLLPVGLVALPALALIAALAVLFESIPWLRGGFGNVVFFWVWIGGLIGIGERVAPFAPGLDPFGTFLFLPDLQATVTALDPTYKGAYSIGGGGDAPSRVFAWPGLDWNATLIAQRLAVFSLAALIALLPVLWFDRFATPGASAHQRLDLVRRWTRLDRGFDALGMVGAELRMLLAGQPWWWVVALLVCAAVQSWQPQALLIGWLLPVLAWSVMGCRAEREEMLPLIFATPRPVLRPVLAAWAAGALLAALAGAGTLAVRMGGGDLWGVLAFAVACTAIPALALACGTVTGSARTFEILWLVLWYVGLLNRAPVFDLMRMDTPEQMLRWAAVSLVALGVALVMRARRLRVGVH